MASLSLSRVKDKQLVKGLRFGGQVDTECIAFTGKRFIQRVIGTIDGQTVLSEPLSSFRYTWQSGRSLFRVPVKVGEVLCPV